jgi:gamma-glutamylcysteine synthetase
LLARALMENYVLAATTACLAVMAIQWYQELQRQTPREDRRAEIQAEQSRRVAARHGITPEREGWTIPLWRLADIQAQQTHTFLHGHANLEQQCQRGGSETSKPQTQG